MGSCADREADLEGSSGQHHAQSAFSPEQVEQLVVILHRSPHTYGKPTSLWMLNLLANVSVEQVRMLHREISDEVLDAAERRQSLDLLNRLNTGPIREAAVSPWWEDEERHPSSEEC